MSGLRWQQELINTAVSSIQQKNRCEGVLNAVPQVGRAR